MSLSHKKSQSIRCCSLRDIELTNFPFTSNNFLKCGNEQEKFPCTNIHISDAKFSKSILSHYNTIRKYILKIYKICVYLGKKTPEELENTDLGLC